MSNPLQRFLSTHHTHDAGLEAIHQTPDHVELTIELPESDPKGGVVILSLWPAPDPMPPWQGPAGILTLELRVEGRGEVLYLGAVPDADPTGFWELRVPFERADIHWVS